MRNVCRYVVIVCGGTRYGQLVHALYVNGRLRRQSAGASDTMEVLKALGIKYELVRCVDTWLKDRHYVFPEKYEELDSKNK